MSQRAAFPGRSNSRSALKFRSVWPADMFLIDRLGRYHRRHRRNRRRNKTRVCGPFSRGNGIAVAAAATFEPS